MYETNKIKNIKINFPKVLQSYYDEEDLIKKWIDSKMDVLGTDAFPLDILHALETYIREVLDKKVKPIEDLYLRTLAE